VKLSFDAPLAWYDNSPTSEPPSLTAFAVAAMSSAYAAHVQDMTAWGAAAALAH